MSIQQEPQKTVWSSAPFIDLLGYNIQLRPSQPFPAVLLLLWLNEPSPHSTGNLVKYLISKAQPQRCLKTVGTSLVSNTNSPAIEHPISGVSRSR